MNLDEVLALWPRLRVSLDDIEASGYFVDLDSLGGEILIRRSDPEVRRRFTTAHEIGHWLLGVESQNHVAVDSVAGAYRSDHVDDVERWCDRFAAELLMPASEVRSWLGGQPDATGVAGQVAAMAGEFWVSEATALYRVSEVISPRVLMVRSRTRIDFQSYSPDATNVDKVDVHHLARRALDGAPPLEPRDPLVGWVKIPGRNSWVFVALHSDDLISAQ